MPEIWNFWICSVAHNNIISESRPTSNIRKKCIRNGRRRNRGEYASTREKFSSSVYWEKRTRMCVREKFIRPLEGFTMPTIFVTRNILGNPRNFQLVFLKIPLRAILYLLNLKTLLLLPDIYT